MTQSLIQINDAKVLFKGQAIFENLNFNWESEQNWAIVGESGEQLTAFLETIRGNTVISSGEISRFFATAYLAEKSTAGEVHSFRDLISYVSQKYEFKNRSNLQNFYFQQRFNSSESEAAATVREILEEIQPKVQGPWTLNKVSRLLQLTHLLDKSILKLSNGETRRLALAKGLMNQPKLYLMDQPMTGLDVKSRANFGRILTEIIQSGIRVLMTASAGEIPEGISHVGYIHPSGSMKTFLVEDFQKFHPMTKPVHAFDWKLLETLLPPFEHQIAVPVWLNAVTIKYGQKEILSNLSWKIEAGERWLLKGKNGAGKSTLISLLIGENPQAYSQDIWLFGRKRGTGESIWDVKRPIGFVAPELVRFFPLNQTCRKVILSGLFDTMGLFRKVSEKQEKLAAQWMQLFKLGEVGERPLNRLSLAQQRWTLLARALIKNPELLILDEAAQGMDEYQRILFKETIQKICEFTSITLIYVSHYEEDVPSSINQNFSLG